MDTKENKKEKNSGSAKEKATFDQNGKGASDKFGQAGDTPNESGYEKGAGTKGKEKK